jgi:uncharacterized protein (DUF433 family)
MQLVIEKVDVPLRTDANGAVRVGTSRVTLDTVIGSFKDGATPEEIVMQYPVLELAHVYQVVAFYLTHQTSVEAYLAEREKLGEEMRHEAERKFDTARIRQRLLARRKPTESC